VPSGSRLARRGPGGDPDRARRDRRPRGLIWTDLGERSLLFRAFYAIGSLRIWGEYPFAGVGPDGFQDAYAAAKIPIATETVQSPHSVIFDWTATLGVFGLAWVGLARLAFHPAVRRAGPNDTAG
jgi:hypothetical protein